MATPLTATARITLRYTVRQFVHRLSCYCAYNLVIGVPQLVDRDGITTILWSLAAQTLWDKMRTIYSTTDQVNVPSATLEQHVGGIWNPVAIATLTGTGSFAQAADLAQQITWVLRDTAFKKLRFIFMETCYGYTLHSPTGYSGVGPLDALTAVLDGSDAGVNNPYRWVKSRGDRFLLATGDVAGMTFDLNDKMKRTRYLE